MTRKFVKWSILKKKKKRRKLSLIQKARDQPNSGLSTATIGIADEVLRRSSRFCHPSPLDLHCMTACWSAVLLLLSLSICWLEQNLFPRMSVRAVLLLCFLEEVYKVLSVAYFSIWLWFREVRWAVGKDTDSCSLVCHSHCCPFLLMHMGDVQRRTGGWPCCMHVISPLASVSWLFTCCGGTVFYLFVTKKWDYSAWSSFHLRALYLAQKMSLPS